MLITVLFKDTRGFVESVRMYCRRHGVSRAAELGVTLRAHTSAYHVTDRVGGPVDIYVSADEALECDGCAIEREPRPLAAELLPL